MDYAIAVPGEDRISAVSFSTVGDGDMESEFTDAVTELFEAMMTTFRWTYEEQAAQERQGAAEPGSEDGE